MTIEEFYRLTDILNSEVLGNFMHGGEADDLIAMFEEAVEKSGMLKKEPLSGAKEVYLDSEIKNIQKQYKTIDEYDGYPATIYASGIERIARHFFELGLKAQNQSS
jgi:hypothetical protein